MMLSWFVPMSYYHNDKSCRNHYPYSSDSKRCLGLRYPSISGKWAWRSWRLLNKSDGLLNSEVYPQIFSSSQEAHWKGSCGILFVGMFSVVCKSNLHSYNGGYELGALKHSNHMEVGSTADSRKICSWFSGLSKKFQTHGMVFLFSELSLGFEFHQSIFCPCFPY